MIDDDRGKNEKETYLTSLVPTAKYITSFLSFLAADVSRHVATLLRNLSNHHHHQQQRHCHCLLPVLLTVT
jgi:hypothetical protein